MKVLLLGPNGQLGSDLRLAAKSGTFAGIDLIPMARAALDVTNLEATTRVLGEAAFDVLINCTSYHRTDEVEANAGQAVAVNAHSVRHLAETCRKKGARLIHISTDYVFGAEERTKPYRETDCPRPLNVYGASKALGEALASAAGCDLTIVRVASLFGVAGSSGKGGNFVETMIRLGREKGELRVVDDQTMSPTATADVARTLLALLDAQAAPGVYHVVNSGAATWHEFACEIVAQAGIEAEVHPIGSGEFPTAAMRPRYSVLDNAKIATTVCPMRHWREALAAYLAAKGHIAA
jgi:dTDP-4-dehydrorhamnose reductase